MRFPWLLRGARLLLVLMAMIAPVAGAQANHAEELSARLFDVREGVPRTQLNSVAALGDGSLWIGADNGAYRFNGHRWAVLPLPDSIQPQNVHDIAMTADGARWMAMRGGVLRDSAGVQRWYPLRHAPVWGMVVTRAIDGVPTLVLATREGALRWTGQGFKALPLPVGFPATNLMVAGTVRGGAHTLWLGSMAGGVARLAEGRWTVFGVADGLSDGQPGALRNGVPHDVHVQHLSATPTGDSVEVLATADEGVYGFIRGRWRRLHTGGVHLRAARFRRDGRYETWTSLSNGDVLADSGSNRWHRIRASPRTPSGPARALTVVPDPDGSALVFVGYTGGELLRFRTGRAERVSVPASYANSAVLAIVVDGASVYVGMAGNGVLERTESQLRAVQDSIRPAAMVRATAVRGGSLWIATQSQGVWRRQEKIWTLDPGSPLGGPLSAMGEGLSPDGQPALVVGNAAGRLYVRTDAGWSRFPNLPFSGKVTGVLTDTINGRPTMLVSVAYGLWRYDGRRWRQLSVPPGSRDAEITTIVRQATGVDSARVWVLTRGAGILRIASGDSATVVPLTDAIDDVLQETLALAIAGDGDLLVGTTNGLLKVAVSPDGRSSRVVASFADEDGLPHNTVTAIARADGQRVWVGTLKGIARLDLSRAQRAPELGALTVALRHEDSTTTEIAEGSTLAWAKRDLRFEFFLRTDYREDDVYYRYELAGPVQLSQNWSLESSASLRALPAGSYQLRVWGVRRYSRPVGPIVRAFRIAPPAWRSAWAQLAYLIAAALGIWGLVRWRMAAFEQRHRGLVEAERRLTDNERRFRVLFEESADAHLLIDGQTIVAANAAAGLLLNDDRDVQPLRGQPVTSFIPRLRPGERAHQLDGAETTVRTVHGEMRPVQLRCTTMPHDGADMAFVELRDLREVQRLAAEREQLEQQLRESQRLEALGTLAGGVAHDFNNLLTVIRNGAEMATVAAIHGRGDQESLWAISHASDRARDLVRQILTFSRRMPTRRDPIVVDELVQELQPMLRASLPVTIRLVIEQDAGDAVVLGDRTQLMQVLLNLATNAEHALRSATSAELTIRTDLTSIPVARADWTQVLPAGEYLRLRVIDNGSGMRDDVRARVFEPFFTTKDVGEGTGLGLSVLHGIVAAHGGGVSVASAPDTGATFEILLPLATTPYDTPDEVPLVVSRPATTEQVRVLLADDEPLVLASTRRLLVHNGFTVTACAAGCEVLALLEGTERYDVLITDYTMPDMTGDMLARAARLRRPDLPVIMVTGVGSDIDAIAQDAGILDVLQKPYNMSDLAATIDRALGVAR